MTADAVTLGAALVVAALALEAGEQLTAGAFVVVFVATVTRMIWEYQISKEHRA